ncbi:hypothetical protein EAE99_011746 [Botrytis elliptica]|nr:hypothetical protein EAE99_011746 [Botrytis elliptica]
MVQGQENGSIFSQSNPECNNLKSQNSIDIQGSHPSISLDALDADAPFHSPDSYKIHRSRHYVKWGIEWQTLCFVILLASCEYALATGHHLCFSSLNKTAAGFVTIFAYATSSLFAAAIGAAYDQHLWTLFKQDSFSLNGLDDLLALKSTPSGSFNVEVLAPAKLAVLSASVPGRLIALAAIAPPATLSVVLGISIESQPAESSEGFYYPRFDTIARPTGELSALTPSAAERMDVLPYYILADNSSYYLQFWGPTIKCSPSTDVQKQIFNKFSASLPVDTTTPYSLPFADTIFTPNLTLFFSFEPGFPIFIFSAFTSLFADFGSFDFDNQNLWSLLSNSSIHSKSKIQLWLQTS